MTAFPLRKLKMYLVDNNKPRSATQVELDDLFCHEVEQRYSEYTYPDFTEGAVQLEMQAATIAVWDQTEQLPKRMIVWWIESDKLSLFYWHEERLYSTHLELPFVHSR